jgi:cell division septation protein DedD
MSSNETAYQVAAAPSSRLRTELNVVAALVAVALSVVILALLANAPASRLGHHAPRATHPARPTHARP